MADRFKLIDIKDVTFIVIGKFVLLWHQFIKKFFDNNGYNFDSDKIRELCKNGNISINDKYLIELKNQANKRRWVLNCSIEKYPFPQGARVLYQKEICTFLDENEKPTLLGGIYLIERIRNNLCHGLKEISDINDQVPLFESINNVLLNIHW